MNEIFLHHSYAEPSTLHSNSENAFGILKPKSKGEGGLVDGRVGL